MSQKARDYTNLRETEKLYDAVGDHQTYVKDYSLAYLIRVYWRMNAEAIRQRLVEITIGDQSGWYHAPDILPVINDMLERATHDKDHWFPRERHDIAPYRENGYPLIISTEGVNEECLRDHLAQITINEATVLLDTEEFLKATRYA